MWINWKRKSKSDLQAQEDKNPWNFRKKMTNLAWIGLVEEEQSKSIWKDLKSVKNMWEKKPF